MALHVMHFHVCILVFLVDNIHNMCGNLVGNIINMSPTPYGCNSVDKADLQQYPRHVRWNCNKLTTEEAWTGTLTHTYLLKLPFTYAHAHFPAIIYFLINPEKKGSVNDLEHYNFFMDMTQTDVSMKL
jgi:hypothetical protein